MRYLFVLFFALCINAPASAQFGFGPEVGLGMSSFRFAPSVYPIDYTAASKSPIFSGKIGAVGDAPFNKHLYFQTGLFLSRKGGVRSFSYYKNDSFNEQVHQTLNINYIDLPVNIVFKSGMQGKGRFIFGIGATASYIIGGRNLLQDQSVYNDTPSSSNGNYKISIGNTLHGFDIGINILAGYEMPTGLFFRAYYTAGVNDIGIGSEIDKNRMWGIAAGYIFGKGRNINKEADELIDKTN